MGKVKTHEEYLKEAKLLRPNAEVIDVYIRSDKKIRHKCECGKVWRITPSHFKAGKQCPECRNRKISASKFKSHADYVKEVKEFRPNTKVLAEYKGSHQLILHQCECGKDWDISPTSFLAGTQCSECGDKKVADSRMRTSEDYKKELTEIRPGTELIGEYLGKDENTDHRCECRGIWPVSPTNFKRGDRCPECRVQSLGEEKIASLFPEFERQFSPDWIGRKAYDFKVGDLLIEFDGQQHFEERDRGVWDKKGGFEKRKEYDVLKTKKALEKGYRILRISYSEIDNVKEIIEKALKSCKRYILIGDEYINAEWFHLNNYVINKVIQ